MRNGILLLVGLLFFAFQIYNIDQYGQTTDSHHVLNRGNFYFYEYNNLEPEKIYEKINSPLLRSYGPLYSQLVVASKHYLFDQYKIFADPVHAYHLPNILASTVTILIVGFFVKSVWGFYPALIAMLTLILMPRFLGHSQTNYKDISNLAFFLPCIFAFYFGFEKKKWFYLLLGGFLTGLAYCVRVHALMIFPIICLWYFLIHLWPFLKDKKFKNFFNESGVFALKLFACVVVSFFTILYFWPYYRLAPIEKFIETFTIMSGNDWTFMQLYLGNNYPADQVPWHYPLVYLSLTMPTFYLALLILGFFLSLRAFLRKTSDASLLVLICIAILTPPGAHVILGTPMYGGIRHWLLIFPFVACLIAYSIWQIYLFSKDKSQTVSKITILLFVFLFGNLVYQNFKLYPYTYIYFNSILGGEANVQHLFTLDHRKQAALEVERWLENAQRRNPEKEYIVFYSKKFNKKPYLKFKKENQDKLPVYTVTANQAELAYVYEKD